MLLPTKIGGFINDKLGADLLIALLNTVGEQLKFAAQRLTRFAVATEIMGELVFCLLGDFFMSARLCF
ncbi:hypothetical protein KKB55_19695 [Myxococcota bacterium]|nr:hypothetical protein [Myxococcota bacterium]MBU1899972.1 hypothetical protein [Myxococcota bacterium]